MRPSLPLVSAIWPDRMRSQSTDMLPCALLWVAATWSCGSEALPCAGPVVTPNHTLACGLRILLRRTGCEEGLCKRL